MSHFHTITAAAATLFEATLSTITADDVAVPTLDADQLAGLDPVDRRRHLGAQLVGAYLSGQARSDLVVAFCAADYRCPRPLFAPVPDRTEGRQLSLLAS